MFTAAIGVCLSRALDLDRRFSVSIGVVEAFIALTCSPLPTSANIWFDPGRLPTTTFQRPDIALAFFMSARNPSVGAGFAFCAKRASSPRGPVFEGFSPSVLSVLCFCESRLSHVVHTNQWVAWAGLTRHLAGGGDRSAAERISAVQARLRKRPSRNPGRTCVPRFRTLRAASLPRHHRAGSPPSASRRPACGIAA